MTPAGTPWGEPRRDALAEVLRQADQAYVSMTGADYWHDMANAVLAHLDAQAAAQGDLVARLVDLVKMMARCLREAGRGDLADVALAELPPSRTP